jgi:hypothetical protein
MTNKKNILNIKNSWDELNDNDGFKRLLIKTTSENSIVFKELDSLLVLA